MNMSGKKLMHVVQYNSYGGVLKHAEAPVPVPKADEVLLKVEASSLNPLDWRIQKGIMRPFLPRKFPQVPGVDVAGEVVEVGSDVKNYKAGDKVVALLSVSNQGGLAEYAVAKENLTAHRPAEVSAEQGAGLPMAALTAHQALVGPSEINLNGTAPNKNVLVIAASGGVGHYAVQLAKLGNCHVTATCGARNMDLVRSLGADEVIDYKTPEGSAYKSPSGKKYDAVIHCASGNGWSEIEPNLSEKGKVVHLTPRPGAFMIFAAKKMTFSKKQLLPMFMTAKSENLEYLVNLVKEGKLRTVVDSKYPLGKAEEGWAKSVDGHASGKIIIEH